MAEFYTQIKWVHVLTVVLSGGLLFARGLAAHFGAGWTMAWPLRWLSYTIDTVLFTAALMLVTIVHQYPFVHAWLTVKVLLLAVYIGLGSLALKRGGTRQVRVTCWVLAILVYVFIISVARTHDPFGLLHHPAALDLGQRPLFGAPLF
ncbi:MAG: SirB2 family protein [Steroidobacteraceae bacterium]